MQNEQQNDRLLTRREAAAILGVAEQTLAMWQSTGRYGLPCVKIGRLVRYSRADLAAWLASRTTNAPRPKSTVASVQS